MDQIILDCGDAIKGESTLDSYKDKIELLSYSHGIAMQITGDQSNQKRTSGRPNHQDFTCTKYVDLASCVLINNCNSANVIPTVKIIIGQNEQGKVNPYLTYELTNAIVASVSIGHGGGDKPVETITFNYTKISWTYKPQKPVGEVSGQNSAKWSLETNKAE
jgi:type VI secretion system secreted protein Hcp